MGWGEFIAIPNEYNDEYKTIDETILTLIQERKRLSKGKRIFPPKEITKQWAAQFDLDVPQINWLMHSLNHPEQPVSPNEPGELINVISIMKKSVFDGFEYLITHAMQHQNGSLVNVEIRGESGDRMGLIRPNLLLEITGGAEYDVRSRGSRGGGGEALLSFLVSPRLPDDIHHIQFSLIPYASPYESRPQEIVLDHEVHFK